MDSSQAMPAVGEGEGGAFEWEEATKLHGTGGVVVVVAVDALRDISLAFALTTRRFARGARARRQRWGGLELRA